MLHSKCSVVNRGSTGVLLSREPGLYRGNVGKVRTHFIFYEMCPGVIKSFVTLSIELWSYKEPHGFIKSVVTLSCHVALSIAMWSYKEPYGVIKSFVSLLRAVLSYKEPYGVIKSL